jgi:hypothetical protein
MRLDLGLDFLGGKVGRNAILRVRRLVESACNSRWSAATSRNWAR